MFNLKTGRSTLMAATVLSSMIFLAGCDDDDDNDGPSASANIRAIHAVPDAPLVNVKLNDAVPIEDLDYEENSGFKGTVPGSYDVVIEAITPAGNVDVITVPGLRLLANSNTTVFAVGTVDATDDADRDLVALPVAASESLPTDVEVAIRVVHAAPVAGAVDIYVTAPTTVLADATPITADFKQDADLGAVPAGEYRIRVTDGAATPNVLYDSGTVDLTPFAGQSLIVAALNSTTQSELDASPIKTVAYTDDGAVELLDEATKAGAKVVHLSPDAAEVEVFANDTVELIPAFSYGDSVAAVDAYALVGAGEYFFDVSPNNDANDDSVYTSPTVTLGAGTESTAIAVGYVGPVSPQPAFELIFSGDENRAYATHARVKVIHGAAAVGNVDVYVAPAGDFNSANIVTSGPDPLLPDFAFKGDSGYVGLTAGSYDIFVAAAGTDTVAITATGVPVAAGDVLTVIARGPDESVGPTVTGTGLVVLSN